MNFRWNLVRKSPMRPGWKKPGRRPKKCLIRPPRSRSKVVRPKAAVVPSGILPFPIMSIRPKSCCGVVILANKIEVLQGPNSVRQLYDLHCGGSTQPYHAIIPTPGPGWTIRIIATNYMEFPFEAVVTPYEQFQDAQGGFNSAGPQSYDLGSGDWHGSDRTTAGAQRW
mmetsp:Transcript_20839/g.23394  ORF Transcript_20839/g.23394 Transcript_20839/m.23394 type:complete len:168 (-) Transcript_20839:352-855(-)